MVYKSKRTVYGPLKTPRPDTININGVKTQKTEIGRRFVGISNIININGRQFSPEEISTIICDALEDATNYLFDTNRFEHTIEIAKMASSVGFALNEYVENAIYDTDRKTGGYILRTSYIPRLRELAERLGIDDNISNEGCASFIISKWEGGTALERNEIIDFIQVEHHEWSLDGFDEFNEDEEDMEA